MVQSQTYSFPLKTLTQHTTESSTQLLPQSKRRSFSFVFFSNPTWVVMFRKTFPRLCEDSEAQGSFLVCDCFPMRTQTEIMSISPSLSERRWRIFQQTDERSAGAKDVAGMIPCYYHQRQFCRAHGSTATRLDCDKVIGFCRNTLLESVLLC